MTLQKNKEKSWNPKNAYEIVNNKINDWPDWKKRAYNEMFATSAHAKKITIIGDLCHK